MEKRARLKNQKEFEDEFCKMWSEEGTLRMAELGLYVDNIRDQKHLLQIMSVWLLQVPLCEYEELAKALPQTIPGSLAYNQLWSEMEFKHGTEEVAAFVHVAIMNDVIDAYNAKRK